MESRTPNYSILWRSLLGSGVLTLVVWVSSNAIARSQAPTTASPTPASPTPAATSTLPARFATLQLGSRGAAVVELQSILRLLGYYSGAIDGQFQESTVRAVAAFQRAAGVEPDGVVGLNTWNRLLPAAPTTAASATAIATPSSSPTAPAPSSTPSAVAPTPSPTPNPSPTSAAPAASPTPATSVDFPVLRRGMRGTAVMRLQERLRSTGFFTGAIDGVFGAQTEAAVQAAQRRFQLQPDGVVGSATWAALLR